MTATEINKKLHEIQALIYCIQATTVESRIIQHLKEIRSAANYLLRRAE